MRSAGLHDVVAQGNNVRFAPVTLFAALGFFAPVGFFAELAFFAPVGFFAGDFFFAAGFVADLARLAGFLAASDIYAIAPMIGVASIL